MQEAEGRLLKQRSREFGALDELAERLLRLNHPLGISLFPHNACAAARRAGAKLGPKQWTDATVEASLFNTTRPAPELLSQTLLRLGVLKVTRILRWCAVQLNTDRPPCLSDSDLYLT